MHTTPPKTRVFLEGRYRKLVRDLPQTVFFCPECKGHPRRRRDCLRCEGFGKLTRESVQELIGWVAGKAFGTRRHKFHGAGREDIDVRMLGRGRPFILEVERPKIFDVDLAALEREINARNPGKIEIQGLHWTERQRVQVIKETPHAKEYEALVEVRGQAAPERIAALLGQRITVLQHTPERVAHRRADKDRERWIELSSIEPAAAPLAAAAGEAAPQELSWWRMRLSTQHGTYVKEALSGEGGATRPSVAELLGVACRCVELDVLEILGAEGETQPAPALPPGFGAGVAT